MHDTTIIDSLINRTHKLKSEQAVISLLQTAMGTTEQLIAQHAKIIIEILQDGQHKLYTCHIMLAGELNGSINPQGRAQVICNPYIDTDFLDNPTRSHDINRSYTGDYQRCNKDTWEVPIEDALRVLSNIQKQKTTIESGEVLLYQKNGKHTWLWNNGGHNCITWCNEKLGLIGLGKGVKPLDSIKGVPSFHVGECSIM